MVLARSWVRWSCRSLLPARYLQLLDEDGGYFVDLINACKKRLLTISPTESRHGPRAARASYGPLLGIRVGT